MLSRRLRIVSAAVLVILLTTYLYHFEFAAVPLLEHQIGQPWLDGAKEEFELPPPTPKSYVDQKSSVLGLLLESTSPVYNVIPSPTPSLASKNPVTPEEQSQTQATTPLNDVLLIFKTGASTVWRRMPLHLTTTLSNAQVPNFVIYSDLEEQLSSVISTIDVIKNETSIVQKFDHEAYESYLDQQSPSHVNTYREHARLPGDEKGEDHSSWMSGWKLDKYKFIPMLAHAQRNWPNLKWYIYIEDDTFIFLNNVMQWLATISPDEEPAYYGAYSGDGNETFAQGGSGIVFSRSLMHSVFGGAHVPTLEKYANETATGCCGDILLGKVLRDHGIYVNKGTYGTPSLRPEPPWKTGFDDYMWCAPVHTFHHLHARDLVTLSELERKYKQKLARPILFRDVFIELISPNLQQSVLSNWDNFASKYILTNDSIPVDLRSLNSTAYERASLSPESCQKACITLPGCMSWRHESADAKCGLDTLVKLGRETDPLPTWATETVITSGWMLERINASLMADRCEVVMYT